MVYQKQLDFGIFLRAASSPRLWSSISYFELGLFTLLPSLLQKKGFLTVALRYF